MTMKEVQDVIKLLGLRERLIVKLAVLPVCAQAKSSDCVGAASVNVL